MMRNTAPIAFCLLAACATEGPAPTSAAPESPGESPVTTAEDLARAHLSTLPGGGELQHLRTVVDGLGQTHVRFQQEYGGVPVLDGQAIAHLGPADAVLDVTHTLHPQLTLDPTPTVDAADAVVLALATLPRTLTSEAPTTELWVVPDRARTRDHLAWKVRIPQLDGSPASDVPVVYIDAHTGAHLWSTTDFKHAAAAATGVSNYSGTVSFEVYESSGTYYMEDTTRGIGTYSAGNTTWTASIVTDTDTSFNSTSQAEAVDGHYAASEFYDFLDDTFGRDGMDDAGGPTYASSILGTGSVFTVIADYGWNYAQAAYSGGAIYLGDGDGSTYLAMTSTDIIGHEMGHGVTTSTANFTYMDESGAIDEHYADVYGAALERYLEGSAANTWHVGEDVYTPSTSGDAVRYMDDPTTDGLSVDHYDDRYTGTADNGGVHINNGIGNLAFVLVVDGGTHPTYGGTSVTGVGFDAALAIWHRALDVYLTSGADYADLRSATRAAATDLYGVSSAELAAVEEAWSLVGIDGLTGCHTTLPGSYNYCSTTCPCDDGEGQCTDDTECNTGLTCVADQGTASGYAWYVDVCLSDCHAGISAGAYNYCAPDCPCEAGEGQCSDDTECASGLTCSKDVGASYGYDWYIDVCEADCHDSLTPGATNYCSPDCPCDEGEGQCTDDTECDSGLTCVADQGAAYGYAWYIDVCLADCHGSISPGAYNYCSPDCPCEAGEGQCTDDTECASGTSCSENVGADYGYAWYIDVCEPTDCHAGTSPGATNYCSPECPCTEGEGQCTDDTECDSGLTCVPDQGADYGYDWYIDVCLADCHGSIEPGAYNYCSPECPCDEGEGQCSDDTECASGLTCVANVGASYGYAWYIDVCEAE